MAEPRIRERAPETCPECGSRQLGPVRPEDIDVAGSRVLPEDAPDAYPGALVCKKCGTVVRWEA